MMIVADQGLRLQVVNQLVGLVQSPVCSGLVPPAVKPDAADFTVVGAQLAELVIHVVEVAIPVTLFLAAAGMASPSQRKIIWVMPVEVRMIEEEFDALLVT